MNRNNLQEYFQSLIWLTHDGSMGLVHIFPTWKPIKINHPCRYIYRSSHGSFRIHGLYYGRQIISPRDPNRVVEMTTEPSGNATSTCLWHQEGVTKNRGIPKWMICMEIPIKMDDLGVPPFSETPKNWPLKHSKQSGSTRHWPAILAYQREKKTRFSGWESWV